MVEVFSKTIANNLSALEQLMGEVTTWLETRNLPIHAVQLALEEVITNTIKYGYSDDANHAIEVRVEIVASFLQLTIVDDGREYNPLLAPEVDVSKPIEEREIGGLGIHLLRKLTTEMHYKRLNGKNILELKISL